MINVSVIIPIYNAEKHLNECLLSLKQQTIENIEFILINDGSTDSSENICKNFLNDKRFIYKKKSNEGHVAAYIDGFKISKGKYIGFVDSDDYIDKNMFLRMYKVATTNKNDIVICDKNDIDDKGNLLSKNTTNQVTFGNYFGSNITKIFDITFPPFNGYHLPNARWNKLFRREIFEKNIKYCSSNPRTFEDRFIVPACIFSSKSIYIMKDSLYFYRHANGTVHTTSRHDLYNILKELQKTQKEMLIENNLYDKYKNKYEIAQLNYLSIFIDRNIITHGTFKEKLFYAKQIIKDKDYQALIKRHKKVMNGRKGLLMKTCFLLKSSLALTILSYLKK